MGPEAVADHEPVHVIRDASFFSTRFPAVVVLGNPGGGKSTLAQGYCLALANACAKDGFRLPIFIRVREYHAATRKDPNLQILTYILRRLSQLSESYQVDELINPIRNLLHSDRCICIFDGLDEILQVTDRISVVNQVTRFISQWPLNSFFTTSRPQGYSEAPLPRSFHQATIAFR